MYSIGVGMKLSRLVADLIQFYEGNLEKDWFIVAVTTQFLNSPNFSKPRDGLLKICLRVSCQTSNVRTVP